ncbi:hypothetical protein B0H21DRAFT_750808 [Amylocystis lapponica]|nr:hypothetical protein B0H21DRAFT_750808 [Amylocystis lapponica]
MSLEDLVLYTKKIAVIHLIERPFGADPRPTGPDITAFDQDHWDPLFAHLCTVFPWPQFRMYTLATLTFEWQRLRDHPLDRDAGFEEALKNAIRVAQILPQHSFGIEDGPFERVYILVWRTAAPNDRLRLYQTPPEIVHALLAHRYHVCFLTSGQLSPSDFTLFHRCLTEPIDDPSNIFGWPHTGDVLLTGFTCIPPHGGMHSLALMGIFTAVPSPAVDTLPTMPTAHQDRRDPPDPRILATNRLLENTTPVVVPPSADTTWPIV